MNTKQIRQTILDLAIRGELVHQDPTDEPASVLLGRIRAEKEQLIKDKKLKRDKKDNEPIDEVPFELPEGWEWCRLGEIAFYKKGPFGSSITKAMFIPKSDNTYKVYEQKNAINKDASIGNYYISKEKFDELRGFEVFPNDIIVSCAGTIGETFILPEGIERGIINQALMRIMVYEKQIIPFYLVYFDFVLKKEANEQGKGIAIKNIPSFDVLKKFLIPLPPLAEQHRIVQKIEQLLTIVDTIEQLQEELKALIKQTKNQVLNYAIAGKLTHQDPNDEPAEELLKRIGKTTAADTPYEKLPKGWAWCRLGDIANISMGQSPKGETVTRNSNGIEFHQGKIYFTDKYIDKSPFSTSEPTKITSNSVLLCVRAPVGEVNLVNREVCIGRGLCAIEPLGNISIDFCFFWLILLKDYFNENSTGSTFSSISGEIIRNAFIPLPPLAEQHRIVEKIETYFSFLDTIESNL
ncbi:restriction endonuclease subunit S [Capnocytophaga gingivalis]|uniref:restriction endonuclease subunit S n=2 Tax=Capnocytophaga gingivalis TaxID=1017 RepID=UPI0028E66389|nr:restriction endonuclease subunit S [Capnocytophaga gingivalis]